MKNILVLLLTFISLSGRAQSVLITPGAQSINGESTNQDQLNVYGNGLLVAPKTKVTTDDPSSNVHTMNCASITYNTSLAGTLKDPSGDANYTGGIPYECGFTFSTADPLFVAYQIDFEVLDTEADGDSVFIINTNTGEKLKSYSGASLPERLVSFYNVAIVFKTDSDANVGAGFVLTWKAILKDGTLSNIQNYQGLGLVYDAASSSLWSGEHSLTSFNNKGSSSIALGYYTGAKGNYSTAFGYFTDAIGNYSTAMGYYTEAIGERSTAMGYSTEASGNSSTAMGFSTKASGDYSTAMGYNTEAIGERSTAMGSSTEAIGNYSTAMGNQTAATGEISTAMGFKTAALGNYSTAMGYETVASGDYATAIGFNTTASGRYSASIGIRNITSGDYSYALGTRASTNGHAGAMVLADYVTSASADTLYADANNRLLARFENGYTFYTDNNLSSATKYGIVAHNKANSWSSVSDSTKKENFIASNGEAVLKSVSEMRIGTWNYKGDDTFKNRHWGVMAQDFYAHFGKDQYGTIGCDTLIATADFDGVSFAAIKALELRTRALQKELAAEKDLSASQDTKISRLEANVQEQNQAYATLKEELKELKGMLMKSVALKEN